MLFNKFHLHLQKSIETCKAHLLNILFAILFMYDQTLIIKSLKRLNKVIENLIESTSCIPDIYDLPKSADGMLRLNGICMCLIIIGAEVKLIDKYTQEQILPTYPAISWKNIIGMRERIFHSYFEVDIDVIFDILRNDIPPLLAIIKQMKNDWS